MTFAGGLTTSPLGLVRSLRAELPSLPLAVVDARLMKIEQSLQQSLSVEQAARLAGEKPGTVHKAIQRGNLPATTVGASNVLRINQADVEVWRNRPKRRPGEVR